MPGIHLTLLLTFLALAPGCTVTQPLVLPADQEPVIYKVASYHKKKASNPLEDYFLEIAMGSEYGIGDFSVKKWTTDLRIEVLGEPTPTDLAILKQVAADLNELLQPVLQVSLVPAEGNVQVFFVNHSEFHEYEPAGLVFYGGFFWNWWDYSGSIYRGRVVIASDHLTQAHRNHLIREELTQVLGLMNDSERYPESIFYQGYSEVDRYTPLDREVIRLLYQPAIYPGMLDFQIREKLQHLARGATPGN